MWTRRSGARLAAEAATDEQRCGEQLSCSRRRSLAAQHSLSPLSATAAVTALPYPLALAPRLPSPRFSPFSQSEKRSQTEQEKRSAKHEQERRKTGIPRPWRTPSACLTHGGEEHTLASSSLET